MLRVRDLALNPLKRRLPLSLRIEDVSFLLCIFITCFLQTLTFFFFTRMANEETIQERTYSQPCPAMRDKRKTLSKTIDMGSLPSRQGHKKTKRKSSKSGAVKPGLVIPHTLAKLPSVQILDEKPSNPEVTLSKTSKSAHMNLLENENLPWERYQQVVTEEDVAVCYDMSAKEFKHSIIHDLFKVFSSS